MTKKELIERLKNVQDDAIILAVDCWKSGIRYGAYWELIPNMSLLIILWNAQSMFH